MHPLLTSLLLLHLSAICWSWPFLQFELHSNLVSINWQCFPSLILFPLSLSWHLPFALIQYLTVSLFKCRDWKLFRSQVLSCFIRGKIETLISPKCALTVNAITGPGRTNPFLSFVEKRAWEGRQCKGPFANNNAFYSNLCFRFCMRKLRKKQEYCKSRFLLLASRQFGFIFKTVNLRNSFLANKNFNGLQISHRISHLQSIEVTEWNSQKLRILKNLFLCYLEMNVCWPSFVDFPSQRWGRSSKECCGLFPLMSTALTFTFSPGFELRK